MSVDDKESSPNDNSGADSVAFYSVLLGGGNITDEEGAYPKENLLATVAAPAEASTAGVVDANGPKGKVADDIDETFSYFSFVPLSQETETMTLLMAEEEG